MIFNLKYILSLFIVFFDEVDRFLGDIRFLMIGVIFVSIVVVFNGRIVFVRITIVLKRIYFVRSYFIGYVGW